MSRSVRKTRLDSQLSRMNCQTFSTGFNSGHLAGNGINVMFAGRISPSYSAH